MARGEVKGKQWTGRRKGAPAARPPCRASVAHLYMVVKMARWRGRHGRAQADSGTPATPAERSAMKARVFAREKRSSAEMAGREPRMSNVVDSLNIANEGHGEGGGGRRNERQRHAGEGVFPCKTPSMFECYSQMSLPWQCVERS